MLSTFLIAWGVLIAAIFGWCLLMVLVTDYPLPAMLVVTAIIAALIALYWPSSAHAAPNPTFTQCPPGQWQHGNRNSGTAVCDPLPTTTTVTTTTRPVATTATTSTVPGTTLPSGTAAPFVIPNQVNVGRNVLSRAILDLFGQDNTAGGIRARPYGQQTGRFWFALNQNPLGEVGILQLSPNGNFLTFVQRGTPLLQPATETPTVVPVPGNGFPPNTTLGFGVGYRVESSGGRTIQETMTCSSCPTTAPCSFQVTFPHGTCDGNPSGPLCSSSADCSTSSHCEYVSNFLDGSATDAVLYVGGCPASRDPADQDWPEEWGEMKYPGDLLLVDELVERTGLAPSVDTTGYVTTAVADPVFSFARVVHGGDPACVGDGIYPPTPLPGNPYYTVSEIHARADGTGGTWTRLACSTFAATLPAFRDDYADSCDANGTCVRKMGFTKFGLYTAASSGSVGHLCATVDGKGSHVVGCQ